MKYFVVVTNGYKGLIVECYEDEQNAIARITELNEFYENNDTELSAHLTKETELSKDEFLAGFNLG